jgi:hypothetical protein
MTHCKRVIAAWLLVTGLATGCGSPESAEDEAPSPCCSADEGLGCGDAEVAACVCAADAFCCDYGWDAVCVAAVPELGCGTCPAGAVDAAFDD